jgi:hypothetical protein
MVIVGVLQLVKSQVPGRFRREVGRGVELMVVGELLLDVADLSPKAVVGSRTGVRLQASP